MIFQDPMGDSRSANDLNDLNCLNELEREIVLAATPPSRSWQDFAVDPRPYRGGLQYSRQAAATEYSGRSVLENVRLWVRSTCRRTRSPTEASSHRLG